eukprot:6180478-Pleurochrysis_carterae.AAC.3
MGKRSEGEGNRRGGGHSGDREWQEEAESERGSLLEESVDSGGRVGEKKEKRSYWKEVEQRVEMGVSERLEDARVAGRAAYEAQVRELKEIVDLTSSEGGKEGQAAERRREIRKAREVKMEERRAQRE